ncbi:hypothetical protein RA263_23640 [Pseudomonas syringae pv. tagetis]|uniref:Uncharacterized protein n=1 Tax=Pseudomonas syringae pv. tagetis TaxID=129140 RepID=A0A0N8T481_9PSED|nr:hypothetical protein [Pseudomonas syringae group genomosp. 7]KPY87656.1 Uncharacterized protein ALO44_00230 [Pseudomonas syringae pv. tagetis]RMW17030.1 hypothetical protein ALO98_04339 [Pseudomonas syringae pv. tagetis]RMW24326.1 hypothetical protein ALO97_03034 [Pseudomonas syringae pv. tagetis]UNB70058.1 hypothetical protein MME58_07475 [Pseudomonas syringae pv. tagetis]
MKLPSDRTILELIYKLYYEEFQNHSREVESGRRSKIYVPIDCQMIARELDVDGDIVFGRLYYHLQKKYGYTNEDESKVLFFGNTNGEGFSINFPLMASVLAGLQEDANKFRTATWISSCALAVSMGTAAFNIFFK